MSTLPSLRAVTAQLRALHEAWAHPDTGGEYVALYSPDVFQGREEQPWRVAAISASEGGTRYGREYVPGDGARFDAVGAARRLLAAARDGV